MVFTNSAWAATFCLMAAHAPTDPHPTELTTVVISVIDQAAVPARQLGQIVSVQVEEGDLVKRHQLLAVIDDGDAKLASGRANLELEAARAEADNTVRIELAKKKLELAESELARGERARRLFENAITQEEIEQRRLKVEQTALEVKQSEHDARQARIQAKLSENALQIAERQVARCRIVAPLDGVVVQVDRRSGEWVQPGDTVLRIVRIDRLRAEGFLKASQLAMVNTNQTVSVSARLASGREAHYTGILKFISPEIIAADNRVRVWAEIQNQDLTLLPGMRAVLMIDQRPGAAK